MAEEADYKALYEQVQAELEQARLTIMRLRFVRSPLDHLNGDAVRKFVQQNYLVLILAIMLFEVVYKLAFSLATKRKDGK